MSRRGSWGDDGVRGFIFQSTPEEFAKRLITAVLANQDSRILSIVHDSLAAISRWIQGSELVVRVLNSVEFRWLYHLDRMAGHELVEHALALPQTLAATQRRPLVVLLDEFQDALTIGGSPLIKRMRGIWQRQPDTAYLFIGSQGSLMRALFGQATHALYRFADILKLPNVPDNIWAEYIERKFAIHGIEVDSEVAPVVLQTTGGHPYDTMKVCQALYDITRDFRASRIMQILRGWR